MTGAREGSAPVVPEAWAVPVTSARPMTGEQRFLAACRLQPVDATPVWYMRQAGRGIPEYERMRDRYGVLGIARTPELAARASTLPIAAYGVDAAVMYADVMLPTGPMGIDFDLTPEGPVVAAPIRSAEDVRRLRVYEPDEDLAFAMEAIRLARHELEGREALIGIAGGPFTLAAYLIEGRATRDQSTARAFMYAQPEAWHDLLGRIAEVGRRYLAAQVRAGAQAVQVFDTWAGSLGADDYEAYVLPHAARLLDGAAGVPAIHYASGATGLLDLLVRAGARTVGIDSRVSLRDAWAALGPDVGIQGNLDGARVLGGWRSAEDGARRILDEAASRPGHIFNLGHGIVPGTDPSLLSRLAAFVHDDSARRRREAAFAGQEVPA
jgi:uroporphyrinogen decarboxylase